MGNNVVIVVLIAVTTVGALALVWSGNAVQAGALIALASTVIPHLGGGSKNNNKDDDEE